MHLKITTIATGAFILTDANVILTVAAGKITDVTYGEVPTTVAGIVARSAGGTTLVEYGRLTEQGKIDMIFSN